MQLDEIKPLKDYHVVGRFFFHGTPEEDAASEIVIYHDQVGLKFRVSSEIESILRKSACDKTPTDRSRCEEHMLRCVEEEYISCLIRLIEHSFRVADEPLEIMGIWRQSYAYFLDKGNHVRLLLLHYDKEHDEDGKRVTSAMMHFYNENKRRGEELPEFEAHPGLYPGGFRKRGQ